MVLTKDLQLAGAYVLTSLTCRACFSPPYEVQSTWAYGRGQRNASGKRASRREREPPESGETPRRGVERVRPTLWVTRPPCRPA